MSIVARKRRVYEDHTADAVGAGLKFVVYEPSDDSYYYTGIHGEGLWCCPEDAMTYRVIADDGFYAGSLNAFRELFNQYIAERMAV